MNATDRAALAVLHAVAIDGVSAVSTRRLAEMIGRSSSTASAALRRLVKDGAVERIGGGRGVSMGRYRVLPKSEENLHKSWTTMSHPESARGMVSDVFRSPALYGAGQLHSVAPKGRPMTIADIASLGVTRSPGGIANQLMKLESLAVPLALSQSDPTHMQRRLWVFQELTPQAEAAILDQLDRLPAPYRPRYRTDQEALHLYQQESYRWQLGMEPYSVIASRDILSNVVEDPFTGCLLFQGTLNNSGYGTVHASHPGIGTHRVVWIAERGPVPAGKELHHECEQRNCVNVEHLQVVTKAEHTLLTWGQPDNELEKTLEPVSGKAC